MSESLSVTDPYLQSLLNDVGRFHVVIGVQDKMRDLILRAYQQGRNQVLRDIAEERSKKKDPTVHFAEIRAKLDQLERNYLQRLAEPPDIPLTAEQMSQVLGKVQEALLNQARKNRT